MNRLPLNKRTQILHMLVEGSSLRSISRVVDVSVNTVTKLLVDAGRACREFHDLQVRGITTQRIQCDEIWSFCYAKQKNAYYIKGTPSHAGDLWTWTALDSDTKLLISWLVSPTRDFFYAKLFMDDLRSRLENRVQLTTDGLRTYLEAVEGAFGSEVDYAQLIKSVRAGDTSEEDEVETAKYVVSGNPDERYISTSHMERHNLTTRMSVRRFTRKTNAFSKDIENHRYALALYFVWYNWCRFHETLKTTPAMAAGLAHTQYGSDWLDNLVERARVSN